MERTCNSWARLKVNSVVLVIAVCAFPGCDKLTPEQKRREEIGTHAAITASFWVPAQRACRGVGSNDVKQCAELNGSLLDEQSAQMMAKLATDQADSYREACRATFSDDYCTRLLRRAVAIENRKPQALESQSAY